MKKLITILFLAIAMNAEAQVATIVNGQPFIDQNPNKYISAKDLNNYKAECYNDSTASYYYTMRDMGSWTLACNPKTDKDCPCHWTHRKPTFEGFILYIEKLYKLK